MVSAFNIIDKVFLNIGRFLRALSLNLQGAKIPLFTKIDYGCRVFNPGLLEIDSGVRIGPDADIFLMGSQNAGGNVRVGANSYIGRNFHIVSGKRIEFGENLMVANNVFISNCRHGVKLNGVPFKDQDLYDYGELIVGNNVWIGERSSIIGGITIGDNVIIGVNEIVAVDVPSNSIFKNGIIRVREK